MFEFQWLLLEVTVDQIRNKILNTQYMPCIDWWHDSLYLFNILTYVSFSLTQGLTTEHILNRD